MTRRRRSAGEHRAPRGPFSLAVVSGLVVIAGLAGLMIGAVAGRDAPPRTEPSPAPTVHDGLRLSLPRGWSRTGAASAEGFRRPLGLRQPDAGLRAVVERLPATSATLLPAAFLASLKRKPEAPELVRLGADREAWRYRFPGRYGSMTAFYAAPTTSGIASVACTSPIQASVPRACAALAAAVSVPGARPLEPGPHAAFFSRLPGVVTDLNVARRKGMTELRSATRARAQAIAADGLARAHETAAATLSPLAGDGAPAATAGALVAAGTAYDALSRAARSRAAQRYENARTAVAGAEANLNRVMTKVAAAARAAGRTTSPLAAARQPAAQHPVASARPASARQAADPVVATHQGASLAPILLALSAMLALSFLLRGARRALR